VHAASPHAECIPLAFNASPASSPLMPSQVRHFFKVGQERAQGKAMVLCLAHQLAEQLPGMAAELQPVVTERGNGSNMSMVDAFWRWAAQGWAWEIHLGSMYAVRMCVLLVINRQVRGCCRYVRRTLPSLPPCAQRRQLQ